MQTQEALVQVPWGVDVLALPGCNAMVDSSAHLIFSGPRVRMGEQPTLMLAACQPQGPASLSPVQAVELPTVVLTAPVPHKPALLRAVRITELPAPVRGPDTLPDWLQCTGHLAEKGCMCTRCCIFMQLTECPASCAGLYEGVPTRVCPHTTSGRADYFG